MNSAPVRFSVVRTARWLVGAGLAIALFCALIGAHDIAVLSGGLALGVVLGAITAVDDIKDALSDSGADVRREPAVPMPASVARPNVAPTAAAREEPVAEPPVATTLRSVGPFVITEDQAKKFIAYLTEQTARLYAARQNTGGENIRNALKLEAHTWERSRTAFIDFIEGRPLARVPPRS